jgi:hypothetical protein
VKSRQKNRPDCMLHALVNLGVVRSYAEALRLNKATQKAAAEISHVSLAEIKRLYGKIFTVGIFLACVFDYKKLKTKLIKKKTRVKQLGKKFTGIVIVDIDNVDENQEIQHHAVAVTNGQVLDSHYGRSFSIKKYHRQKLFLAYQVEMPKDKLPISNRKFRPKFSKKYLKK